MSKKITIGMALAAVLIAIATTIPLTMLYAQNMQNQIIPDLPRRMEQFRALEEIRTIVQDNFYRSFDGDVITAEMVGGYLDGLGDELSRYLSPEEFRAFEQRIEGQQPDLGFDLYYNPNPGDISEDVMTEEGHYGALIVTHVRTDSPAERAGLRSGDRITLVETDTTVIFDEENLTTQNYHTQINNILDFEDDEILDAAIDVIITFEREGEARPPIRVMIGHNVSTISTELMEGAGDEDGYVGYIRIAAFYRGTATQLQSAIDSLIRAGASSFVLDLRGTYDGTTEFAIDAINRLVPTGDAIATIHFRDGTTQPFPSTAEHTNPFALVANGMVILVNQQTAGPAELFAYALSIFHPVDVTLIGRPTVGIYTMQRAFPLTEVGGAALLSVGIIVPVGGDANWNRNGVQPQMVVNGAATQLAAAIEHLTLDE